MWPFSKKEAAGPTEPVSFSMRERIQKIEDANPLPLAADKRTKPRPEDVERMYASLLKRVGEKLKDHDFDREEDCRPEFTSVEMRVGAVERVISMIRDAGYQVERNTAWLRIWI